MASALETAPTTPLDPSPEHERLQRLVGSWAGTAKTWMEPEKPPLEAPWEGRMASVLGGRFLRFEYQSSLNGKPFAGELLLGWDRGEKRWTSAWIDSFHTGSAILVQQGKEGQSQVIEVAGTYFVPDNPRWGWRTVFEEGRAGTLVMRMYNIWPEGRADLGIEVEFSRR